MNGVQSLNGEHNFVRVKNVGGGQLACIKELDVRQVVGAAACVENRPPSVGGFRF